MPSISVQAQSAAVTVGGTDTGYIGVADVTGFVVGAHGHLSGPSSQVSVMITDIITLTNLIGLRILQDPPQNTTTLNYGRSDLSDFTAGSRFSQDSQVCRINPAYSQIGYSSGS